MYTFLAQVPWEYQVHVLMDVANYQGRKRVYNNSPESWGKMRAATAWEGVCVRRKRMKKKESKSDKRTKFQTRETESDTEENRRLVTSSGLCGF